MNIEMSQGLRSLPLNRPGGSQITETEYGRRQKKLTPEEGHVRFIRTH